MQIRRLLRYLGAHRGRLLLTFGLLLALTGIELVTPFLNMLLVDRYLVPARTAGRVPEWPARWFPEDALQVGLLTAVAMTVGLLLTRLALHFVKANLLGSVGYHSSHEVRTNLFAHLHRIPLSYHEERATGETLDRLTRDPESLADFFRATCPAIAWNVVVALGIALLFVWMQWQLALAALLPIPFLLASLAWERSWYGPQAQREQDARTRLNAFMEERLEGWREILLLNQEQESGREYSAHSARLRDVQLAGLQPAALAAFTRELAGSLALAAILGLGSFLVLRGGTTLGILVVFLIYFHYFYRPLRELCARLVSLPAVAVTAERVFEALDTPIEDRPETYEHFPGDGPVEFRDVWFSYRPEEWVLQGVSFLLPAGATTAIVGPTGGGKSTILSLLLGFREPTRGVILWNGVDIRRLDPRELRRHLGVAFQDPQLLTGSVADNVDFGRATARSDIEAAARQVGAEALIASLPRGYEEVVGPGSSVQLSSGQSQLIALARALARSPRYLLLDEATSSLDGAAEKRTLASLWPALSHRTTLMVAHRLAAVRRAEQILVLVNGRILERGTHDQLLAERGYYHSLHALQACQEELGPDAE